MKLLRNEVLLFEEAVLNCDKFFTFLRIKNLERILEILITHCIFVPKMFEVNPMSLLDS